MHSLQGCFFDVSIEGNMPGYHNLKYYSMHSHSKEIKFNRTTLQNCLKDQESKTLPGFKLT